MGGERLLALLISQEEHSDLGLITHLCILALEQEADGGDQLLLQSYPSGLALKFQHHVKSP